MLQSSRPVQVGAAPGPRGRFLIGSLTDIARDLLGTMARDFAIYGDVVRYRVGPSQIFILSHPDLAQEVLVTRHREFPKMGGRGGLGIVLGNGLVSNIDHESWLTHRRMIQPMFHRQCIIGMGHKISDACGRTLERLAQHPHNRAIDINHEMLQATLDVIMQTMFSADMLSEVGKLAPAVMAGIEYANHRIFNPWSAPLGVPTARNRAYIKARRILNAMVYQLMEEHRANGHRNGDLLDMLLLARDADTGEGMSDAQIHDEVLTIFAAGHETTANTLAFAWYALSQHPEILQRLEAEVDSVLQGRLPTMDDLPKLPYTLQVFRETMRMYPAAPIVTMRQPQVDTKLGGYDIPAKSRLIISIFNIHRHPDFWPHPDQFDPDRFDQNQAKGRHYQAFMPFGAGPRKCLGNNLAEIEGTMLIAAIASRYRLRLQPGHVVEPQMAITMRTKTGIPMLIEPRH
jgi:cytochrome P450